MGVLFILKNCLQVSIDVACRCRTRGWPSFGPLKEFVQSFGALERRTERACTGGGKSGKSDGSIRMEEWMV